MYNVTSTTGVITLRPKHGNNGYYTIGVGSASVPIPSGTAPIDIDMYMIADASGEPLLPSMAPQTRLRQSIGSEVEEIEIEYGAGTNIQTKTIIATKQYNGVVTKDKDFYFSMAGVACDSLYDGNITPHIPDLYSIYNAGLSGKSIVITYRSIHAAYGESWHTSVMRNGSVNFITNTSSSTDYVEEFAPFIELTYAYNEYLESLSLEEDDKKAIEAIEGVRMFEIGASIIRIVYIILKSGDAIKVTVNTGAIMPFVFIPDVDKMLLTDTFSKSEEFIYDAKNNTFVPLYSDGERNDIVCAWEIPRIGKPKTIYHYADGTYIYKHNGNEVPLTIEGAPFDFVEGKECDDHNAVGVYAVYPGYILKLVLGTGVDEVRVNNYSYQSNNHSDLLNLKQCSMPSGYTSRFRTWLNTTYPPQEIDPCYVSYPCFIENGGNICYGSFAITPAAYVSGGYSADMSLLVFNYGGEAERLNETRDSLPMTYLDNDAFFADAITWSRLERTTALVSKSIPVIETVTQAETRPLNTASYGITMGTTEDTKDAFCWADVRKG